VAPSSTMSPSVGSFDFVEPCPKPISTPELRTSPKTPKTTTVIEAKEAVWEPESCFFYSRPQISTKTGSLKFGVK
jgi:hypothetical protein